MEFVPHDYQSYCIEYIRTHPVAALFLDMGLGKTVITLTALRSLIYDEPAVSKVLVIAPLRVARCTWPDEVRKWDHLRDLSISVIVGDARTREKALRTKALIYVVNRENVKWLIDYYIDKWDFDCVVVDELSSFKNPSSQRFRALRKVRPLVRRWIGLTGTPTSNGLMDLWAEMYVLDGGARLGRFIGRYRESFFTPQSMNPSTHIVYSYRLRPGAEEQIYRRISDVTISMRALDYLHMPECISVTHLVELSPDEQLAYDEMRKEMVISLEGKDVDAATAAVLSGKLLQMANGAVYTEDHEIVYIHDHKLDMLDDLIEAANGQSVLLVYWYRHDFHRIRSRHPEAVELRSDEDIREWNLGHIPVALIHPASAGHGLNLQKGGHIIIWYGLTWSLEMYQQTNARLWRQGQTQTVTIHHIVTEDTVDEDVMEAIEMKDVSQRRLLAAVKARLK